MIAHFPFLDGHPTKPAAQHFKKPAHDSPDPFTCFVTPP